MYICADIIFSIFFLYIIIIIFKALTKTIAGYASVAEFVWTSFDIFMDCKYF